MVKLVTFRNEGTCIRNLFVHFDVRITRTCDLHPLTPKFYRVKLGFTGVYIIFLFLLKAETVGAR